MDKLVLIFYLLLPVLLFAGAKITKKGEWNDQVLSFDHTKAFLGFASIIIIFHHASQRTCAPWLPQFRIHHGLDVFVYMGYLCVAAFFLCSGYGMYTASRKEGFFKSFFKVRILPILLPALIMWVVFFISELVMGVKIGFPIIINVYSYIWYIPAIIYLYFCFYNSFGRIKDEKTASIVMWLGIVFYIIVCVIFSPGSWWYNTVHLFGVGVGLARHKEKRMEEYKKGYALKLILFALLFIIPFAFASYYYEILNLVGIKSNQLVNFVRFISEPVLQMISAYAFAILVLLIGLKIRIGNPVLKFLGGFTLETYLVHPLFIQAFSFAFVMDNAKPVLYIQNQFLYILATIILSLPIAFGLNRLMRLLKKK